MPVTRIIWSAHAEDRRSQRLIDQAAVEDAIFAGHAGRTINRGDADWRLDGHLADGRRLAVVYDHPVHARPGVVLVVSVWNLCRRSATKYPGGSVATQLHYDPDVDIAFLSIEKGRAVSNEYAWGLIDRDPDDGHLMGFEVWQASKVLPPEVIAALPRPGDANGGGPTGHLRPTAA